MKDSSTLQFQLIEKARERLIKHYFFTDSIKGEIMKTDAKDFKRQNIFFIVIFIFLFSLEMSYGFMSQQLSIFINYRTWK